MEGPPAYDPNNVIYYSDYRTSPNLMTTDLTSRTLRGTGLARVWKKYIGCNTLGKINPHEEEALTKKRKACHHLKQAYWGPINAWLGRGYALKKPINPDGGVDGGSRRAARKGERRARNRSRR